MVRRRRGRARGRVGKGGGKAGLGAQAFEQGMAAGHGAKGDGRKADPGGKAGEISRAPGR